MRNAILGTVAGLIIGTAGALAYNHFAGDGSTLADLQAQLDAANAKLAKAEADKKFLKEQNNSETEQLNQILASNDPTKKPADATGDAPAAPAAPTAAPSPFDPNLIRGIMAAMARGGRGGGFRAPEQRMFLLQARLKLDPNQATAIRAAMDADQKARRDLFQQARDSGQRPDPQAMAAINSYEKTLATVLTPSQQAAYQQLQSDQKTAQAESSATSQVDDLMPLLQLTDDQKEKAMNALYQQQLSAPDPGTLMANPGNAIGTLTQQGRTIEAAMQKVLTPSQYALYQQQQQVTAQAWANGPGGGRNRGNNNGGGNGAPGSPAPTPAVATPTPVAATATTTTTTDTTSATTNASSADTASSTNAASATTNAASATAPAAQAN